MYLALINEIEQRIINDSLALIEVLNNVKNGIESDYSIYFSTTEFEKMLHNKELYVEKNNAVLPIKFLIYNKILEFSLKGKMTGRAIIRQKLLKHFKQNENNVFKFEDIKNIVLKILEETK